MFSNPTHVIAECNIQAGQRIADFGAGAGAYAVAAAKALISTGTVYAIDVHNDLLVKLRNEAAHAGVHNIQTIWGDIEKARGTKLQDLSIDWVFLCNVLFQLDHKDATIEEARRVLKSGGRVLVVDWAPGSPIGPRKEHLVSSGSIKSALEKSGFHIEKDIPVGNHHYGFIAKKL